MKKWFWISLLLLCGLLAASPISGSADSWYDPDPTALRIFDATFYADQLTQDISGRAWTWTAATNTFTLDDCSFPELGYTHIYLPERCKTVVISGENRFGHLYKQGDLTLTGSGELYAGAISVEGRFTLASGTLYAGLNIYANAVSIKGGEMLSADPEIGSISQIHATKNIVMTAGTLTDVQLDSVNGDIRVTGGQYAYFSEHIVQPYTPFVARKGTLTLSGKANVEIDYNEMFRYVKKIYINGKRQSRFLHELLVKNGKLVYGYLGKGFTINNTYISEKNRQKDLSGDGWTWSARKLTLTLDDPNIPYTVFTKTPNTTIALANGARVKLSLETGERAIQVPIRLTGQGKITNTIRFSAQGSLIIANADLTVGNMTFKKGNLIINNSTVVSGGPVFVDRGNINITNSTVIGKLASYKNITVRNSLIVAPGVNGEGQGGIFSRQRVTIRDSLILCSKIQGKSFSTSKSVFFVGDLVDNNTYVYVLAKNGTLVKPFRLPENIPLYIPAGLKLTLKAPLTLPAGTTITVDGKLSGASFLRYEGTRPAARAFSIPPSAIEGRLPEAS